MNEESIFLPAAGFPDGGYLYDEGLNGCYWSRTFDGSSEYVHTLYFFSNWWDTEGRSRFEGHSVRPVRNK